MDSEEWRNPAGEAPGDPLFELLIEEEGLPDGLLTREELVGLANNLQKILNRVASFELEGEPRQKNYPRQVRQDCSLLFGTSAGSTCVQAYSKSLQENLGEEDPLPQKAASRLFHGLRLAEEEPERAREILDEMTLESIADLFDCIPEGQHVSWTSPVLGEAVTPVDITGDLRQTVSDLRIEPNRFYREIVGTVQKISSDPIQFKFQTVEGWSISAQPDQRHRDILAEAWRDEKWVQARGIATFRPGKEYPEEIATDEIEIIDGPRSPGVRRPEETPKGKLESLTGEWGEGFEEMNSTDLVRRLRMEVWGP